MSGTDQLQRYAIAVLGHLALVAAWHFFVVLGKVPSFVMPSPWATIQALVQPNYRWTENVLATAGEIF
ncbi:MAG: ABC transporter permease, partial [Proteobacteria bacterium]|nr:ABC transporter permease [Pseudomonadota bacterium]